MFKLTRLCVYLFLAFITLTLLFIPNILSYANSEVIYIDPGHGGYDGGCVGSKIVEKDLTLTISLKLKNYLESIGYKVKLTRTKDIALDQIKAKDMKKRVSLINNSNTLLYISIHANYFPSSNVFGGQVFYKDDPLNELLSRSIQKYFNDTGIGNKRNAKTITDKYLTDNIYTNGCIVEVGFLSNNLEEKKLQDDNYQSLIAYAIYLGILNYLDSI
ncbi:MAG: N-acetylmuramoyl-L-alanine amidase [Bacilli bacterium]|nr:N-acetylmuramoyl-L-alanine amidase [Bacilli bacterium]